LDQESQHPPAGRISEAPELVFGLVGAAGTDLSKVVDDLADELSSVGYKAETFVLSKLMATLPRFEWLKDLIGQKEDNRIRKSMETGNELRSIMENGDAVARLAISAIRNFRESKNAQESRYRELEKKALASIPILGQAYILKSLKHRGEHQCLQELYGDRFILISVYEPRAKRIENLAKRIAKSYNEVYRKKFIDIAEELIDIDEKEEDEEYGQQVRDVFPLADIFVSFDESLKSQIRRFIQILFGAPYRTPKRDEFGMFHARAAALRSADLSRQVGAVITTGDGEIIAAGCNEVPKAGGGSVWEGEINRDKDYRDFRIGYDSSSAMKLEIVTEVFEALKQNKWLNSKIRKEEPRKLAKRALYEENDKILSNKRIASILEYGRIVHAEMSAITDAARRGVRVQDATLYCTTFPCHMCARHIMAAGVRRVVYIEPYPKSMVEELYQRSMSVDGSPGADEDAVRFEAFVGVAPRRYLQLFQMPGRKDARGYAYSEDAVAKTPRLDARFALPSELEAGYEESLEEEKYKLFGVHNADAGSDDRGARGGLARASGKNRTGRGRVLGSVEEGGGAERG
jgi:deoxycytidylate deaminase